MTQTSARDRLVGSARRRFATDGALATTLDDVRGDAAVSVGSLYHHFGSKERLAAAVYAEVMTDYQSAFLRELLDHAEAEPGIRGAVRLHLGWIEANRADATLLLGQRYDSEALREANRALFDAVRRWWAPHEAYGALQGFEPAVTYALWIGPAQEYARLWIDSAQATIPAGVVDAFAGAAWASLRGAGR